MNRKEKAHNKEKFLKKERVLKKKKAFWTQIMQAFIAVVMIPVLCLGGFIFYSARHYIYGQRMTETADLLRLNRQELDNWAKQCESSVRYLAGNYTLQEFLQMDERDYVAVNQSARVVSTILYGTLLSTSDYKKITVYTDKDFTGMSNLIESAQEVREEKWYQDIWDTAGMKWWYEDHHFYVGKKITTAYPVKAIGVFVIEMEEEAFFHKFSMLEEIPSRVALWDGDQAFCEYETGTGLKKSGLSSRAKWGNTGWTLAYQVDQSYCRPTSWMGLCIPMLVVCAVIMAAFLCTRFLSRFLVRDLDSLVKAVDEVRSGDLDVKLPSSEIHETAVLSESIQGMLDRIKQLIHQVYDTEIERQRVELDLLQSKISPHFLYNNLSMINWMAIDCGEDKISEVATEMAAFYRTALNKGKTVDCLRVEMANIQAYIRLVQYARESPFDVSYEVDEELLDYKIPTFILQPLAENAIEHGIDRLEGETGQIRITVKSDGEELLLEVFDNGKELFREIGEGTLKREKYGYGTGNVDRRIRLLFGEPYGLTVRADAKGTVSSIRLGNRLP